MKNDIGEVTQRLLAAAKAAGAPHADAIAVSANSISIEVLNGRLEQAERSEGVDVGLRVILKDKQACVSSSDLRDETFANMAERAVAMAKEAPSDPVVGLADPDQLAKNWNAQALELFDPSEEPGASALEDAARVAEEAARQVKGVSQVQSASAGYGQQSIALATSNGFSGGYDRSSRSVSCVAISGEGTSMERDYHGEARIFAEDFPDIKMIGQIAGERAVARIGSKKPPTGVYPVLFDERISSSLIGHLTMAINGSAIARGSSWARDLMGKQILPTGIDLTEDPHRIRISGSRPFDGEGLPTVRRDIVKDGVLQSWTLDLATARKLGLESTGNAARGTSAPPSPSLGNLMLSPGSKSPEALLSEMGTGLWVTSMIGSTINPNTGDYSRGASGFWVENGEIVGPVNECTVAGNLVEMLRRMVVSNDGRPHLSRVIPSIMIDGMMLAGS